MQIVIPMAGSGQRFIDAGYKIPKPLISFGNIPMIEKVINLFPGEKNIIFICNQDHLERTKMRAIIKKIMPLAKIIGIKPHKKGPVYSICQVSDQIDDNEEVIVHYCDVAKYWNYSDFLKHTRDRNADGALSCNRGFHPHMLTGNCYALVDANNQWFNSITEKKPLDDIDKEYASDGAYYFKNGKILKKYSKLLIDRDINIAGEYYVSMVYNLLKEDNLNISVYEIQHMLSMQTPGDLAEYNRWSKYFENAVKDSKDIQAEKKSVNLIPLAGRGSRFVKEGYKIPKPLIEVCGKPMIIQASESLPDAEKRIFVCLAEHLDKYPLKREIKKHYPDAEIVRLDKVTEGQACTIEYGLKNVGLDSPVMIGACDFGSLWNKKEYQKLIDDKKVDAIVWSFRHHPNAITHPEMYGWIKTKKNGTVTGISVKVPISDDPYNDHAFTGAMYFRKARYFLDALKELYKKNIRIKGEYYLDSCINILVEQKLKVKVFEVDHYAAWGTPDELKTYEYWQSYFHKCNDHPYSLEIDPAVNKSKTNELNKKYRKFSQKYR